MIGGVDGLTQGGRSGAHAHHTAAAGHQLAVLDRRASVEDLVKEREAKVSHKI